MYTRIIHGFSFCDVLGDEAVAKLLGADHVGEDIEVDVHAEAQPVVRATYYEPDGVDVQITAVFLGDKDIYKELSQAELDRLLERATDVYIDSYSVGDFEPDYYDDDD